jgi:DNA replication protein DnaC
MSALVPELLVRTHAKRLRLPVMAGQAARFAEEAATAGHGPLEFLASLLSAEVAGRDVSVERSRIAAAHFPELKELFDFDFAAIGSRNAPLVAELARGAYLARREVIFAVGPPGTGKTHVATALGLAACRMGRRVRFVTVAGLVTELAEAQAEHCLSKLGAALDRLDLLICDELGFVRLDPDQSQLLFTLLAHQ